MIKTRQDNDMTNQIGLAYVEIKIELSGPIELDVVFYENQKWQQHDQSYRCGIHQ